MAGLKSDLATEKDAREVEKSQYDRTAESAAAALKALKQEIEQLNAQLEQERNERRGDKAAADENVAAERDAFQVERAELKKSLEKERAGREAENAKAAAEAKRLKDLVEKKEGELKQLQEEMENLRDEFESKAQKVQSEVSTHTTVITTIKEEKHTLEKLLSAYRLYIDGQVVAVGPGRSDNANSGSDHMVYDSVDVTAALNAARRAALAAIGSAWPTIAGTPRVARAETSGRRTWASSANGSQKSSPCK